MEAGNAACYGICRRSCHSKSGDQAGGQKLTDLKNAILQSVRYADIQDFSKDFGIQAPLIAHDDLVTFLKQHYDQHRRQYSGKKRGQRRSCSTDSNTVDQNGISCNIYQICHQRYLHGHLGISHRTEQSCTTVINSQKRKGHRHNIKINSCSTHDIRFHIAVKQCQQSPVPDQRYRHKQKGHTPNRYKQLIGGPAYHFLISVSHVLCCHNRTTACHGREQTDQQHTDTVHKRNPGYYSFSTAGCHHCVSHSHCDCQKLFYDQWPQ